jgi:hypothetical protein
MPNWCATTVIFTGHEKDLRQFYDDFIIAQQTIKDGSDGCIGRLLALKGIDYREIDCRGFYTYIGLEDDHVILDSDDAWEPCTEAYNIFAEMYNLSYVLKAEEPGNMVYINTDVEGRFFPERYMFEAYNLDLSDSKDSQLLDIFNELDNIRYFENEDQILKVFEDYKQRDIKTLEDFKELVDEYSDYVNFAEFTVGG